MKLLDYENPITGKKGKMSDVGGIANQIKGVLLLLFVLAMGQNVARFISGRVKQIDTSPEPIFSSPAPAGAVKRVW